ncbi:type II toxin-antitoxin system RelE family toxin [Spirosoma lacussanchae]
MGDYRIIYSVQDSLLTVEILKIGDRKDNYS